MTGIASVWNWVTSSGISTYEMYNRWKEAVAVTVNGAIQAKRILAELPKLEERYRWNRIHLLVMAIERTYSYCIRDIYFSCKGGVTSSLSEHEIRLLIKEHTESDVKEAFTEIFQYVQRMQAADILSLNLSSLPFVQEEVKKELDMLPPPLDIQRPAPSVDDRTTAWALYTILANRDSSSCLYELEGYHRGVDKLLKDRGINSELPPVSELVLKVVQEKVLELFDEVTLRRPTAKEA